MKKQLITCILLNTLMATTLHAGGMGAGGMGAGGMGSGGMGSGGMGAGGMGSATTGDPTVGTSVREPTYISGYYRVQSYRLLELAEPKIQVHIYGTANVSSWMLDQTANMARGILTSIRDTNNILKFNDHHIFVITDNDPDVPGAALTGHKNTGNQNYTIINQVLICAKAVDTIRPNLPAEWRAWDTPIHEFGHAIEHTLQLESTSDEIFSTTDNYNAGVAREYFAWNTETWFNSHINNLANPLVDWREKSLPLGVFNYFSEVFDNTKFWQPTCAGRP